MRGIKFRGLAVVNDKHNGIKVGDFVFGSFIQSGCDAPCIIFGDGEQIEIDIKTLGQCIGYLGLFEGDVINDNVGTGYIEYSERFAGFRVNYGNGRCKWFYDYTDSEQGSIERIGNIHQNKELLNDSS